MSEPAKVFKVLACFALMTFTFCQCSSRTGEDFSDDARFMELTSNHTEIVLLSVRVPGYWAKQVTDKEKFFLYTLIGTYKKGDILKVEGTYGNANAAVFNDETRVYESGHRTNIFVVWKAVRSDHEEDRRQTARTDLRK
jgi:hypothetical protein